MGYFRRVEWGARYGNGNPMGTPVSETYIHHTAGPVPRDEAAHMRELEAFHVNTRGWSGIAYSEVVFPSGNVYEGRGLGRTGAHTLDHNSVSHAWCFVGNFENEQPTAGALRACGDRVRWAMGNGFVRPGTPIRGHRDVNQTACPGRNLYARLPDIRAFAAGGAAPASAPAAPINKETGSMLIRDETNGAIYLMGPGFAEHVTDPAEVALLRFMGVPFHNVSQTVIEKLVRALRTPRHAFE